MAFQDTSVVRESKMDPVAKDGFHYQEGVTPPPRHYYESKQLLAQWQERLTAFLEGVDIGVYHGGKKKPSGQIDIATYQSLINKKDNTVDEIVQGYGQVIIDECHHISAPSFEMVLNEVRTKYVLGLTATPYRQDGHQKIIFMVAGRFATM